MGIRVRFQTLKSLLKDNLTCITIHFLIHFIIISMGQGEKKKASMNWNHFKNSCDFFLIGITFIINDKDFVNSRRRQNRNIYFKNKIKEGMW